MKNSRKKDIRKRLLALFLVSAVMFCQISSAEETDTAEQYETAATEAVVPAADEDALPAPPEEAASISDDETTAADEASAESSAGTSEKVYSETPEEISEKTSEEVPEKASEETPVGVLEEVFEETPVEVPKDAFEEIPVEAPEDASEETPVEVPEEAFEEIPVEAPEDASEETPVEVPEEAFEEIPVEAPEETSEKTPVEMLEEAFEETPEETPEEASEEVPEEASEEVPEEASGDISSEKPTEDLAEETNAPPSVEPASLPFSVTEIDEIRITLTAADESDCGTLPSIRRISDDTLTACTENALGPKPKEGRTVRIQHLLIKICGGTVSCRVRVRMEHAGLKKWKLEAGEKAESNALIVRLENDKATRIEAAVLWDTDEISFETDTETILDYFLTAVNTDTKPETETEMASEDATVTVSGEEIMETADNSHTEKFSETEATVTNEEPDEIISEPSLAAASVAFNQFVFVNGVKITVTAAPGVFPAGSVLSVNQVTAAQQAQVDRAINQAQDDQTKVARSYSFDIRILDENGNELQPAEGQTVNVSFSLAEVADANLQTTVYHMAEQENGIMNAEKLETQETGQTVIAQSDGFSVYTLTFYYDKCQYSLMPGGSIPVSGLVGMVGLTGTPTSAVLSSPSEKGSGVFLTGTAPDWTITGETLPAFKPQTLTVQLQSISYEILLAVSDQEQKNDAVFYQDQSGKKQAWTGGFMEVGNANLQSGGGFTGWWVVTGDITVDHRMMVYGDVKLVLTDDHSLVVNGGIQVFPGNSLTIYGQEKGTGILKAVSAELTNETLTATGAGIGGAFMTEGAGDTGKITIHGGQITAISNAPGCAGIGGGTNGTAEVIITGGSVTGTGNGTGPGIGGNGKNTTVKIIGGKATGIGGKKGGADITGQKKESSQNSTGTTGSNTSGTSNKTGNASTPVSKNTSGESSASGESKTYTEIDTEQNSDANKSKDLPEDNPFRDIYDADAEEESGQLLTDDSEPRKYAPSGSVYHRRTSAEEDPLQPMEGKNVILISISGSCEGSRMLPIFEQDGILYSNYLAAQIPERNPEEVLRKGMDAAASGSTEELISSFGFRLAPEDINSKTPATATDLPAAAAGEHMNECISWILSDGYSLNTEGLPFYIGIQLRSTYSGIPATATDLTEATDNTVVFDNCLENLVNALHQYDLLDHTVIILLTDKDGLAVIIHPGREHGVTVSEKTGDEDILKTILTLGVVENGLEVPLPEGLKGQDLLSLPESAGAQ